MPDSQTLKPWIDKLAGLRVLVLGDVILDEYVIGRTTRLSREAPVPVLEFESRQFIPGGAANPAANITALGSTAVQIGVIGADAPASHLREVLKQRGIATSALVTDPTRPTTLKLRILAQMGLRFPQQVARLDTLSREPISAKVTAEILELVEEEIQNVNAVLVSDYHAGLLTPALVKSARGLAELTGTLLTADAQGELDKYAGFGLVKCNADEASDYLRRDLRDDDDFAVAGGELCEQLGLSSGMVITRGPDGATLCSADGEVYHCPAPAVSDVYDTVGAGDTTIAVLTLAIAAGAPYPEAVMLANYASGLVVRRVGNYTPTRVELAGAIDEWNNS
jgi:D-glycero-beta-D-manno-heptose-7-phosphate kinase